MTVGPIPWTAIHQYAVAVGIEDEDRFARMIRAMDSAALRMHRKHTEDG